MKVTNALLLVLVVLIGGLWWRLESGEVGKQNAEAVVEHVRDSMHERSVVAQEGEVRAACYGITIKLPPLDDVKESLKRSEVCQDSLRLVPSHIRQDVSKCALDAPFGSDYEPGLLACFNSAGLSYPF